DRETEGGHTAINLAVFRLKTSTRRATASADRIDNHLRWRDCERHIADLRNYRTVRANLQARPGMQDDDIGIECDLADVVLVPVLVFVTRIKESAVRIGMLPIAVNPSEHFHEQALACEGGAAFGFHQRAERLIVFRSGVCVTSAGVADAVS